MHDNAALLDAQWRYRLGDGVVSDDFVEPDLDDHHWPKTPAVSAFSEGVSSYRGNFTTHATAGRTRTWLSIDTRLRGLSTWLDGRYLGDAENFVIPTVFDITGAARERDEHCLALAVPSDDAMLPVTLRTVMSGNNAFTRFRALCTDADNHHAVVRLNAEIDSVKACESVVVTSLGDVIDTRTLQLAAGRNRVSWSVSVDHPVLWSPLDDEPYSYRVSVELTDSPNGDVSDSRDFGIGLRRAEVQRGRLEINGRSIALRAVSSHDRAVTGGSTGFTAVDLDDVELASTTLDRADETGTVVICPAPETSRNAREFVEAFGHHPSLVAWTRPNIGPRWLSRNDLALRALTRFDPTRPVITRLPMVASLARLDLLRRARHLVNGYVVRRGDRELIEIVSRPVRVSLSTRGLQRRSRQLIDVHLFNDSRHDLGSSDVEVVARWTERRQVFSKASAGIRSGTSSYLGTMVLPAAIDGDEVVFEWSIDSPEPVTGTVTRKVDSNGMIQGVKKK